MKRKIKYTKPFVLCGPRGSGKTEFSKYTSNLLSYQYINIGEKLSSKLQEISINPKSRSEIGQLFINYFGLKGYSDIVRQYSKDKTVLDGIRIADVVLNYKNSIGGNVIFRVGANGITDPNFFRESDGFENELDAIYEISDLIVPWFPEINDLYSYIEDLLLI